MSPAFRSNLLQIGLPVILALGLFMPDWAIFLGIISLAKGLVVLGLMLLWRTGLVSFGQGLFYGAGAYMVGILPQYLPITDALLLVLISAVAAGFLAFALGFLLRRYREIFFAMLCLAFSMIFFGILVKSESLGSTDGFNVVETSYLGFVPEEPIVMQRMLYITAAVVAWFACLFVNRYLGSTMGRLSRAIKDNELRVEYLGFSAKRAVHFKIVIAGTMAGAGGALAAIAIGHVDPEMVWWIQSGEFVFVTILSGVGNVIAPLLGSVVFEILRTFAIEYAPQAWQFVVGGCLLAVIMFLPGGLWSLIERSKEGKDDGNSSR
ncbi:branched-chain amino acid ABC transporter permease [Hwanghaeella grinnelliae]|uniref:Branched-chain amino acid ABC transporter permease n=1 Tax=Hwanghaeella grinnelliae TaxID=2500179 RepID=A0A437QHU2_9PROT|nr:branched-chain amino acid ABC transporter permease [Hwanghaeella grinnelliae]RVU34004.1 branched-chain amino acid ABC transporter permease [Hwanghaeella grinnelliae]